MQDRISLYPGRVTLTPVAGQENTFDLVRADQPTQEGTPLSKESLLKDSTATILGLPNTAVPDDAFMALALPAGKYAISVTLKSPGGRTMSGVPLSGIVTAAGNTVVTNGNGVGFGFSTNSPTTITADISAFLDLTGTASVTLTPQEKLINQAEIVCTRSSSAQATFSASKIVRFSPDVSEYDASAIGGGANGGASKIDKNQYNSYLYAEGGSGGQAGGVLNLEKQKYTFPNPIALVVGAIGGVSKIGDTPTPAGVPGGKGATATYNGSKKTFTESTAGSDTSGFLYPPTDVGGSGGGGGAYNGGWSANFPPASGGAPGGGRGGTIDMITTDSMQGSKPGAGGGGAGGGISKEGSSVVNHQPGNGVAGLVGIMWRYR